MQNKNSANLAEVHATSILKFSARTILEKLNFRQRPELTPAILTQPLIYFSLRNMLLRFIRFLFFILIAHSCIHQEQRPVGQSPQDRGSIQESKFTPKLEFKNSHKDIAIRIDSLKKKLEHQERNLEGFSQEGTSVDIWMYKSSILKVEIEALHETGRAFTELFWDHGSLVAAREQVIDYGANIMELRDKPTPTKVTKETWLEFSGKRLKLWIENSTKMSVLSSDTKDITHRYLVLAHNLKSLANKKDPRSNSKDKDISGWICKGSTWDEGICKSIECAE